MFKWHLLQCYLFTSLRKHRSWKILNLLLWIRIRLVKLLLKTFSIYLLKWPSLLKFSIYGKRWVFNYWFPLEKLEKWLKSIFALTIVWTVSLQNSFCLSIDWQTTKFVQRFFVNYNYPFLSMLSYWMDLPNPFLSFPLLMANRHVCWGIEGLHRV